MDIKIYVPCHQKTYIPQSEILVPIQAGATLQKEHFEHMLHDDEGDHISEKNKMYCELTAQYWVWKNQDSDYTGFFHYRRYFNFSPVRMKEDGWGNVEYKKPLNEKILSELHIRDDKMAELIAGYDVIVPKRRKLPGKQTVQSQYAKSEDQHKKDLICVLDVLLEKFPEYRDSVDAYMQSKKAYECNMFIMRRSIFEEYAAWLFDILFEAEKRLEQKDYNQSELRALAYLGERLFGIWYTHHKKENIWKTLELQKTLFRKTQPGEKIDTAENEVTIVMSCNDSFCPVLAVCICSVLCHRNADRHYKVFVLNHDISERNKRKLYQLQRSNFRIHFINIGDQISSYRLHVDQHITIETYFRLFIPELFRCKKILYLDCDTIVNEDVAKLYDCNTGGYYAAVCRDIDVMGTMKCKKEVYQYITDTVGCQTGAYFQAGVILMNLEKIRSRYTTRALLDIACRKKWKYWDQDVLNYAFEGNVRYLPQKWNVLMNWESAAGSRMDVIKKAPYQYYSEYCEARKHPCVVHFAGYQKPWEEADCDLAEYFWKYARKTPFYESLLRHLAEYSYARKRPENGMLEICGKGQESPVMVSRILLKVQKRMNRKFPVGSKKREVLSYIMNKFVK